MQRLEELEKEEEMLDQARENMMVEESEDDELDPDLKNAYKEIKSRRGIFKIEHKIKKNQRAFPKNKHLSDLKKTAQNNEVVDALEKKAKRAEKKGKRAMDVEDEAENSNLMEDEDEKQEKDIERKLKDRKRSISRSKSKGFKIEKTEMAKVINYHYLLYIIKLIFFLLVLLLFEPFRLNSISIFRLLIINFIGWRKNEEENRKTMEENRSSW